VKVVRQILIPRHYDPFKVEALIHRKYPMNLRRETFKYVDEAEFNKVFYEAISEL